MAAPGKGCWSGSEVYQHHGQQKVCSSRPKYREGRRDRAVKVYTINLESRYLMVQGVPAIGVMTELVQLCALYGVVEEYRPLDEYPAEEFTEVYLIKFQRLPSARAAKRHMDEKSFFGGVLHVCYVPEYETVEDTRLKLQDRRRYVMRTAQRKVREKEQEEEVKKEPTPSDTAAATSVRITSTSTDISNTGDSSSTSHYLGFPLLPLPPREDYSRRRTDLHRTIPTEDKMGTLHNSITDTRPQPTQSSSCSQTSNTDGGGESRVTSHQASALQFVPRTTHLENRKRRMQESTNHLLFDLTGEKEPMIGPKLPAPPPKLDMEDGSLNTTVSMIRNTMKQVASVPDVKPVEKKIKPRRRI